MMAEAASKTKHEASVKAARMPLGAKLYQGWLGVVSKLKSTPMSIKMPRGAAARRRDWSKGRGSVYTEVPPITDTSIEEIGFYGVVQPFSYVRATYNKTT